MKTLIANNTAKPLAAPMPAACARLYVVGMRWRALAFVASSAVDLESF
jgi:hypothetical protein